MNELLRLRRCNPDVLLTTITVKLLQTQLRLVEKRADVGEPKSDPSSNRLCCVAGEKESVWICCETQQEVQLCLSEILDLVSIYFMPSNASRSVRDQPPMKVIDEVTL